MKARLPSSIGADRPSRKCLLVPSGLVSIEALRAPDLEKLRYVFEAIGLARKGLRGRVPLIILDIVLVIVLVMGPLNLNGSTSSSHVTT